MSLLLNFRRPLRIARLDQKGSPGPEKRRSEATSITIPEFVLPTCRELPIKAGADP